mmetsp:Transcript_499/g.823  ORF Transcript_499/g.823 Transcript_499/m.823 type:complete len:207 (+) Transcript_499:50-670(+)
MHTFYTQTLFVVALAHSFAGASGEGVVKLGDACGVDGADFLDDSFTANFRVSGGPGCSLGADQTNCYCSAVLGDADPLGEWIWQCNSVTPEAVPFGPASGKICPAEIPVPVGFNEDINPSCDSSSPTGQNGDPPCAYSDCETGGDFSAVCGCVDLTFGQGDNDAGDLQWFCLHSNCYCGSEPSSAPVLVAGMIPLVVLATAVTMWL